MVVDGVFHQGAVHLTGQVAAFLGEGWLMVDGGEHVGHLLQCGHGHEIGWHEEEQGSGVVRWTKHGGNQTYGLHRCAPSAIVHGVELTVGDAQKLVRAATVLALLLLEGLQHLLTDVDPQVVEDAGVAGHLPVFVGQAQGIAERVDFVFALVEFGLHAAVVFHPSAVGVGIAVEGVGVGVETDVVELAQDDAFEHLLQVLVLVGKLQVGPYLSAGIASPHGVNVAGVDEGVGRAVAVLGIVDGGVEGVGEAVLKHPGQIRTVLEQFLYLLNLLLDDVRPEEPFFGRGSL